MFTLSPDEIQTVIAAVIALITALYGVWQNRQKNTVIAAFTPGTPESQTPAVIASLPVRSWKMNDATVRWLTFDATPENKEAILRQIREAEAEKLTSYQIHFDGGYYEIEYGLLKGGAGNPA